MKRVFLIFVFGCISMPFLLAQTFSTKEKLIFEAKIDSFISEFTYAASMSSGMSFSSKTANKFKLFFKQKDTKIYNDVLLSPVYETINIDQYINMVKSNFSTGLVVKFENIVLKETKKIGGIYIFDISARKSIYGLTDDLTYEYEYYLDLKIEGNLNLTSFLLTSYKIASNTNENYDNINIEGASEINGDEYGMTYKVEAMKNVAYYEWEIPSYATGSSNTNHIEINFTSPPTAPIKVSAYDLNKNVLYTKSFNFENTSVVISDYSSNQISAEIKDQLYLGVVRLNSNINNMVCDASGIRHGIRAKGEAVYVRDFVLNRGISIGYQAGLSVFGFKSSIDEIPSEIQQGTTGDLINEINTYSEQIDLLGFGGILGLRTGLVYGKYTPFFVIGFEPGFLVQKKYNIQVTFLDKTAGSHTNDLENMKNFLLSSFSELGVRYATFKGTLNFSLSYYRSNSFSKILKEKEIWEFLPEQRKSIFTSENFTSGLFSHGIKIGVSYVLPKKNKIIKLDL